MHWHKNKHGQLAREGSHDRQWTITPLQSQRVDLHLTHWTGEGVAVSTKVAQCMSAAEAQIFAVALDNAGHPVGTKIDELLVGRGFQEAPHFSRDLEQQVMEAVCSASPDGHRYMHHYRRWFGSEDMSVFITTTRTGVFPFYCMIMRDDRAAPPKASRVEPAQVPVRHGFQRTAEPDTLLVEPRLFRMAPSSYYGQNGGTADPILPTFTVACLAIMKERLELNGSYAARLEEGQQHDLVDFFAAGYEWPEPESDPEPLMLGMGR